MFRLTITKDIRKFQDVLIRMWMFLFSPTLAIEITPRIGISCEKFTIFFTSLVFQGQSTLGKMDFGNIRCQLFTTIKQNRLIQDFKLSNQTYLLQKNVQDT